MNDPAVGIRVERYVYGKVAKARGGPVDPQFEHRATSITTGFPSELLAMCRPPELLANRSVQALVRADRAKVGAQWIWPVAVGRQHWMLATCVRPRPESGESGLSRTYTQLTTYCFSEADWCRHAPLLLANAPRWLRTEPDIQPSHGDEEYPLRPSTLEWSSSQLPEAPLCTSVPLPKSGTRLWRLLAVFEQANRQLACGPADGIDDTATFFRALACIAALMPEELRVYLTASAGFARIEPVFALQFQPDAPALPRLPPALIAQIAGELRQDQQAEDKAGVADWQAHWRTLRETDRRFTGTFEPLGSASAWAVGNEPNAPETSAAGAREALASALDTLSAERSQDDLKRWLAERRPDPPAKPVPYQNKNGRIWVQTLAGHLSGWLEGTETTGLSRALCCIATLRDRDNGNADQNTLDNFWSDAWQNAVNEGSPSIRLPTGSVLLRPVLCWSALMALPPEHWRDEKRWSQRVGALADFAELYALTIGVREAVAVSPRDGETLGRALQAPAFAACLADLRERADAILVAYPYQVIDLHEATPGLLVPPTGEGNVRVKAAGEVLACVDLACQLVGATRSGDSRCDRARAAARALRARVQDYLSLGASKVEPRELLARLLECWWRSAVPPSGRFDPETGALRDGAKLWHDAIDLLVGVLAKERGIATTLTWVHAEILSTYTASLPALGDDARNGDRRSQVAAKIAETVLGAAVAAEKDPAMRALLLLESLPSLAEIAPGLGFDMDPVKETLGEAWKARMHAALQESGSDSKVLRKVFLPLLSDLVQKLADQATTPAADGHPSWRPSQAQTEAVLHLTGPAMHRTSQSQPPPTRERILDLVRQLERLTHATSCNKREPPVSEALDVVARALARHLLRWVELEPPSPWLPGAKRPLHELPIRQALAERLGFPMAMYFGGVMGGGDGQFKSPARPDFNPIPSVAERLQLDQSSSLAIDRVIAFGAARAWQQVGQRRSDGPNRLKILLIDQQAEPCLKALTGIIRAAADPIVTALESQTAFVIAFYLALDGQPPPPWARRVPEPIERALLRSGGPDPLCHGLLLGRSLAKYARWEPARSLGSLFSAANGADRFAKCVLGLDRTGWSTFLDGTNEERRQCLLRVLYLLALVVVDPSQRCGLRTLIADEQARAVFRLPIANMLPKRSMEKFLSEARNRDIAKALHESQTRTRLPLPGWPIPV